MSTNPSREGRSTSTANVCEMPGMSTPTKEHEWLRRFVGEWESDIEAFMDPSQPPMKSKGASSERMLGDLWLLSEGGNDAMPYKFLLILGYDPNKRKYVGTWTDTMAAYLWKYEGTVNAAGNILTLETEGPSPMTPDRISKFREVTEFKSNDHRVFTSSIQGEDGKWSKMLTVTSRRKK